MIKKILILSPNTVMLIPNLQKGLTDSYAREFKVEFLKDIHPQDADLILLDYALIQEENSPHRHVLEFKEKLAILTVLVDHIKINHILQETKVRHIFGMSGPNTFSDIRDFIISVFTNKPWGIETFIRRPLHKSLHQFISSENVTGQVQEAMSGHDFSDWFEGIEDYLVQILNEGVTNAIFNAPVDELGSHMYRRLDRKKVIFQIPDKEPILEIATDPKKLVLSIKDFYGSLTPEEIYEFLTRGEIREKEGGAGIGLFLVFKYAHKLILNIDKNKSTEMIVVIEHDKRFKFFMSKEKSFHLFFRES